MPLETGDECRTELEAIIRRRISETGAIPFAEFMSLCLYHPQYGYYMAPRERIGKAGDFFTSSSVHALFGALIARQLQQMWELLGKGSFTIAEQGAGEGHLCLDILDALSKDAPEFYERLRYCLVEISPDAQKRQRNRLSRHETRIQWCSVEDLADMEGCILSNELLDAFPVHVVEKREDLKEVYVTEKGGRFEEELRPLSTREISDYFAAIGIDLAPGCRAEVNLDAARWIRRMGGLLKRGFILTIDYGYPAADLYSPARKNGTLMCYHRHSSSDNPYDKIGCQDITSHIDFTTLQHLGEEAGLTSLYFGEQYRFLMGLGFLEILMDLQAREPDERHAQALRLTLKNLVLPEGGMGETFKVLIQGKGVGTPRLLCSRSIRDIVLPAGI